MRIVERGTIPVPDNRNFNSNSFPGILILPCGRWLASFKAAEKKGDCDFMHAVICWSDDQGKNWSVPFEPVTLPSLNDRSGQSRIAYMLSLGEGEVLMLLNWVDCSDLAAPYYDPLQETLKDTRIFYTFSKDKGETWSAPGLMQMDTINAPVPLTGPPLRLNDGTLICQFEINKAIGDERPWIHQSALIFSSDNGQTWVDPAIVTAAPNMFYWDQRPAVLSDGLSVIDFFWTLDGHHNRYVNIHARLSRDGGRNWGPLWDTGIYGQPGQPVSLSDGRLLTIDIDRSVKPVVTVRASVDLGHAFEQMIPVYEAELPKQDSKTLSMNDAWDEMLQFSVGHPNLVKISEKEVLAYYYAGTDCDHTRICFVRIEL